MTQACQSLLTWSPVGIHPIVWRILISKGRRPFSQTSANPCPRLDLRFPRGAEGQCRKMGPLQRGQALFTHSSAGRQLPRDRVSVCTGGRGALPLLAQCPPGPPCSLSPSLLPPSLLLSLPLFPSPLLFSSSFLPLFLLANVWVPFLLRICAVQPLMRLHGSPQVAHRPEEDSASHRNTHGRSCDCGSLGAVRAHQSSPNLAWRSGWLSEGGNGFLTSGMRLSM